MKPFRLLLCAMLLATFPASRAAEPGAGWAYVYTGDLALNGPQCLDGYWNHINGSDQWDGSGLGGTFMPGNAPGGAMIVTNRSDLGTDIFLRMQDAGNAKAYAFNGLVPYQDPANEKICFGHLIAAEGGTDHILDEGVTLAFRIRIPTAATGPIDPLFPAGGGGPIPYPEGGDGYTLQNEGKGGIGIAQTNGQIVSFSLVSTNDGVDAGLMVGKPELLVPVDPLVWHEYWVTIQTNRTANPGSHQVDILIDRVPHRITFYFTPDTQGSADYRLVSYLAIGMNQSGQSGALDVDYFAWRPGVHLPPGMDQFPPQIEDLTPAQGTDEAPAGEGIGFRATTFAPNSISPAGIRLFLNGDDVSADLEISGSAENRIVAYKKLKPNETYFGKVVVTDQAGRSSVDFLDFNTLSGGAIVVEAEDYNYDSGQFRDYSPPAGYAGLSGRSGVDYSMSFPNQHSEYRAADSVATPVSQDVARTRFSDANARDYVLARWATGDWLNYTRTFSPGRYRPYLRAGGLSNQIFRLERVVGSASQADQNTQPLGFFLVAGPPVSQSGFRLIGLTDANGNAKEVDLRDQTTLRLAVADSGGPDQVNFLYFQFLSELPPQGVLISGIQATADGISFTFPTESGRSYAVQASDSLTPISWQAFKSVTGDGNLQTVADSAAGQPKRFYRVVSD